MRAEEIERIMEAIYRGESCESCGATWGEYEDHVLRHREDCQYLAAVERFELRLLEVERKEEGMDVDPWLDEDSSDYDRPETGSWMTVAGFGWRWCVS